MKIALILVGNIRTWPICRQNFIDNFKHINFDIFLSTYDLQYGYNESLKNFINDHSDNILTEKDIWDLFQGFNLKKIDLENWDNTFNFIEKESLNFGISSMAEPSNQYGMKSDYGQHRKLKRSLDLMQQYEQENNFKYDIVIKTRTDVLHNSIDISLNENEILLNRNLNGGPAGEYPEDQVILCSRDNMINLSNFIYNEYYHPVYTTSVVNRPHGILKNAIEHLNLKKNTRNYISCIVRKNR